MSKKMKWERQKSTLHIAEGENGTFTIRESRRFGTKRFWVKYRSKKPGGKNFDMPPCGSLTMAKFMAEDNAYWETGKETLKAAEKKEEKEPSHAFAPKREVKRWDMRYQ